MQLEKILPDFQVAAPNCDESSFKKTISDPLQLAERLSFEKANSLKSQYPDSIIIGGDQVCECDGVIFSKPGSFEKAFEQLKKLSDKTHRLLTSISLVHSQGTHTFTDITKLTMKKLTDEQIHDYLCIDEPFDCAGSYKIEQMGAELFSKIETQDHSAITGVPLKELAIRLKELT
jgi:septum formation protein